MLLIFFFFITNAHALTLSLPEAEQQALAHSPLIKQADSSLEAALSQIIYRAQNYNLEGVPNVVEADRKKIEDSDIDRFAVVTDVLRKYAVLNGLGADIYDDLHRLRKYRNKIHIQEDMKISGASRDEGAIFTEDLTTWALDLNRRVLLHLSEALARPEHIHGHVGPLKVPG